MTHLRTFVTKHPAAAGGALHRHSAPYLALVLEGGYEECSVDGVWRCEPGDLVVHPALHLHLNRFSRRRSRVFNIVLAATPRVGPSSYGVFRPRDPDSFRRVHRMEDDGIAELLADATRAEPMAPCSALSRMATRMTSDPRGRIGDAASHPAMTREHASRTFRRYFGFPPSVFRSEQRFRRALLLLADPATPLATVALDAGYADQAHLTRDFKARTGASPGVFRRSLGLQRWITSVQS
ncbi:MAG TPA: helix-turn-helix domain-containing protein [Candidatus Eisenbacteria bacterium]|nr:helix-turn-helix domain-containing protein [Candidatus Eisenbacteria bacterium]